MLDHDLATRYHPWYSTYLTQTLDLIHDLFMPDPHSRPNEGTWRATSKPIHGPHHSSHTLLHDTSSYRNILRGDPCHPATDLLHR